MIDKKVKFQIYSRGETTEHEGLILDKILILERVTKQKPSGLGGVVSCEDYMNIDAYLIELPSGELKRVRCGDISKIIKDESLQS